MVNRSQISRSRQQLEGARGRAAQLQQEVDAQDASTCEQIKNDIEKNISRAGFMSRDVLPVEVKILTGNHPDILQIKFKKYWTGPNDGSVNDTLGIGDRNVLEPEYAGMPNFAVVLKNLGKKHKYNLQTCEDYTSITFTLTDDLLKDWETLLKSIYQVTTMQTKLMDGKALEGHAAKVTEGKGRGSREVG